MSDLQWVATELLTGNIIADLPDLDVTSVKRSIGRYEPATAELPLPTAPENWRRVAMGGATNLILLDENPNDSAHGIPIWGGMVTLPTINQGDTIPLSLSTIEAYFDRRFVGDHNYVNVGQNDIVKSLVLAHAAAGSNGGIPIRVQYTTAGAGTLRSIEYKDQDDVTLYSALTSLMALDGGPEWTVEWEWQTNPERITPVLYVGDRIGTAVRPGMGPNATFEFPGSVKEISIPQDYSGGRGANDVMAVSAGQGDVRPQSARQVTADPYRPTFEHRFSAGNSITDVGQLNQFAVAAARAMVNGTSSISMKTVIAPGIPRIGVDWAIGDDVGYVVNAPAFPDGDSGLARVIGWERTLKGLNQVTPILSALT